MKRLHSHAWNVHFRKLGSFPNGTVCDCDAVCSWEIATFPVAENIHKHNILFQSIVPARVDGSIQEKAKELATTLAEKLGLVGTLAVELFLTNEGKLLVNELAPRPHNSGHYTLDLCETSQFEQHIRAICGLPLGGTALYQRV